MFIPLTTSCTAKKETCPTTNSKWMCPKKRFEAQTSRRFSSSICMRKTGIPGHGGQNTFDIVRYYVISNFRISIYRNFPYGINAITLAILIGTHNGPKTMCSTSVFTP